MNPRKPVAGALIAVAVVAGIYGAADTIARTMAATFTPTSAAGNSTPAVLLPTTLNFNDQPR